MEVRTARATSLTGEIRSTGARIPVFAILGIGALVLFSSFSGPACGSGPLPPPKPGLHSLSSVNWVMIATPSQKLPELAYTSMAYDPVDGYVVLFGMNSSSVTSETWTYHAGNWTKLKVASEPSPRSGEALAYDRGDGYLLLDGGRSVEKFRHGCHDLISSPICKDTWKFVGGNWTQLHPSGGGPRQANAKAAFDSSSNQVIVGGGTPAHFTVKQTSWWGYRADRWRVISLVPSSSNPSSGGGVYGAMSKTSSNRTLVYVEPSSTGSPAIAKVWSYTSKNWSLTNGSGGPSLRYYWPTTTSGVSGLAFDPLTRSVILVGGGPSSNQTWRYSAHGWRNLSIASPDPRLGTLITFDAADGYMLLYGWAPGPISTGGYPAETWSLA